MGTQYQQDHAERKSLGFCLAAVNPTADKLSAKFTLLSERKLESCGKPQYVLALSNITRVDLS